jgi:hypothetical protein
MYQTSVKVLLVEEESMRKSFCLIILIVQKNYMTLGMSKPFFM